MNESVVDAATRGLLIGAVLGLLGFVVNIVWKLIRSRSEGARRFKLVSGLALVLMVVSAIVAGIGVLGALTICVMIAAIVWVFKGFKKTESAYPAMGPKSHHSCNRAEVDETEFTETKEAVPQKKTIIKCPNCNGRLRVLADKYIDVNCPCCKTVFRTHT